jgi:Haem-binding domain
MNMARAKILVTALVALFLIAQFVQPARTNPPVIPSRSLQAHVPVPPNVMPILNRSCGDCHSSATVWPWYSHFAPVSWLVVDDVNTGRRHVNFQDWEAQENPKEAAEHLSLICKEVREKGMPPFSYRLMHNDSRLSQQDIDTLCSWSQAVGAPLETDQEHHH